MEKEVRNYNLDVRALEESRSVEGYALVFNSLSEDLGGFREQIDSNALNGVLERSDVMALLNHDSSRGILARSRYGEGSLTLTVDEKGLRYNFEAPHSALGDEVLEYLKRGDINQSSFAFTVSSDSWEKQSDGSYLRTITGFDRLYDVSPVFTPAYAATSVKCARFQEVVAAEAEENKRKLEELEKEEQLKKEQEEQEKAEKLKEYYSNIKSQYSEYLK